MTYFSQARTLIAKEAAEKAVQLMTFGSYSELSPQAVDETFLWAAAVRYSLLDVGWLTRCTFAKTS